MNRIRISQFAKEKTDYYELKQYATPGMLVAIESSSEYHPISDIVYRTGNNIDTVFIKHIAGLDVYHLESSKGKWKMYSIDNDDISIINQLFVGELNDEDTTITRTKGATKP